MSVEMTVFTPRASSSRQKSIAGFSDHKTVDVNVNDAAGGLSGGFGKKMLQDADVIDVEASDIEEIEGDEDADV